MTHFHGKPCAIKGHGTLRYVKGRSCVACGRLAAARRREKELKMGIKSPYELYPPEYGLIGAARRRAKEHGVPCTLTLNDIVVTDTCPILGIPLIKGEKVAGPNSPTLDRIKPELGYVPGNVWVISMKANQIKSNATAAEIMKVAEAMMALEM